MQEMVTLSRKEQRRLQLLNCVEVGSMSMREAAELMALSGRMVCVRCSFGVLRDSWPIGRQLECGRSE